jgi:hypothetical protein
LITNVNDVAANVSISGSTALEFGDSVPDGYLLLGGTIDAHADTGTVTTFLSHVGLNAGNAAQTFIAGTGTDFVTIGNFGGDVIDFSVGGTDTVTFTAAPLAGGGLLTNPLHIYNSVLGFTAANDSVNISVGGIPTVYTDTHAPVLAGDAATPLDITLGVHPGGAVHANYLDIITPTSGAGQTAQAAFTSAMTGSAVTGLGAGNNYVTSYYDLTDSQAVLATVTSSGGGIVTGASAIHVIGLIHESAADYAGLAGNLHFVA